MGFNKKKKGARSYYLLFCSVAQTDQVLDVHHRSGNVYDSNGVDAFIGQCLRSVRSAGSLAFFHDSCSRLATRSLRNSILLCCLALVFLNSRSCSARLVAFPFQLSRLRRMRDSLCMGNSTDSQSNPSYFYRYVRKLQKFLWDLYPGMKKSGYRPEFRQPTKALHPPN